MLGDTAGEATWGDTLFGVLESDKGVGFIKQSEREKRERSQRKKNKNKNKKKRNKKNKNMFGSSKK